MPKIQGPLGEIYKYFEVKQLSNCFRCCIVILYSFAGIAMIESLE